MRQLMQLILDTRGVGAIEHVLIASLIAVAGIAAFQELGGHVDSQYVEVEQAVSAAS